MIIDPPKVSSLLIWTPSLPTFLMRIFISQIYSLHAIVLIIPIAYGLYNRLRKYVHYAYEKPRKRYAAK